MQILQRKNEFDIIDNVEIINELPIGNYELCIGGFGRIYLNKIQDIILPEKVYSNDTAFIEHVLHGWKEGEGNMGIALSGLKGLGKSFTGNMIAKRLNVPVIRITSSLENNPQIFSVLNSIKQDYCLFIDEFEKNFSALKNQNSESMAQQDFLTFLDGGTSRDNRIMFIITSNSSSSINDFLKNRPSRLKYFKEYERLHEKVIREIVSDLLVNTAHKADLMENLPIEGLNVDVLIQIIKEINTHDKPYSNFRDFFNYKVKEYTMYDLAVIIEGKPVVFKTFTTDNVYDDDFVGKHPLNPSWRLYGNSSFFLETCDPNKDSVYYEVTEANGETTQVFLKVIATKSEFKNLSKVF